MNNTRTKFLIAHRGAQKIITENTLDSVLLAFKYGATHVEIDIRKTKDGKLVLFHDPITFKFDRKISLVSHREMESLEQISLSKGGRITTLGTLLAALKDLPGRLVIETKTLGLEEEILKLIDNYDFWDRVIVWSFRHQSIKTFQQLGGKKIKKAIILSLRPIFEKDILRRAFDCGADFVYPVFRNLNIRLFRQHGIGLMKMYKNENDAKNFLKQGGAGIMTANIEMFQGLARGFA